MFRLLLFISTVGFLGGCSGYIEPEFMRQSNFTEEYNHVVKQLKSCSKTIDNETDLVDNLVGSIHKDTVFDLEIQGKGVDNKDLNVVVMYTEHYFDIINKELILQTRIKYGDSSIHYFLTYPYDSCSLTEVVRVVK